MKKINAKVSKRLIENQKKFTPILNSAREKDVNESDTVTIIMDILSDLFGYDKYTEITKEHAIRGTYCDIAIVSKDQIQLLIEVKAIGIELKDHHVKQASDYATNKGADWVILTNGIDWRIYKIKFTKPIETELVYEFDLTQLNTKKEDHLEYLYMLSKEGPCNVVLPQYHVQKQATSKFVIGNLLSTEPVSKVLKQYLNKLYPDIKIELLDIQNSLKQNVIRREVLESDEGKAAQKKITQLFKKIEREKEKSKNNNAK